MQTRTQRTIANETSTFSNVKCMIESDYALSKQNKKQTQKYHQMLWTMEWARKMAVKSTYPLFAIKIQ